MLKVFVAVRYDGEEISQGEVLAKVVEVGYCQFPVDEKDGSRSFTIEGEIAPKDLEALVNALLQQRNEMS